MDITSTQLVLRAGLALLCSLSAIGCAVQHPEPRAAIVPVEIEGQRYRIRSVYTPGEGESFNELIGPNYVARDENQDGVLDAVILGQVDLAEAQRIYERAIAQLESQNRLRRVEGGNLTWRYEENGFRYQIKTIEVQGRGYVNEFTVTTRAATPTAELVVAIDSDADGRLDEIVRGALPLIEAQTRYEAAIEKGLRKGKLVRQDSLVVVRK